MSFSLRLDDAKTPVVVNNDNFTVEAQEYIYQMMFDWVAEQLDTYAVAALSYRPFNRDKEHDVQINGRFFSIWGRQYRPVSKSACQVQRLAHKGGFRRGVWITPRGVG